MFLRSSLVTGSVTPLMLVRMDALPSLPPREVWVMDWSSCWTFSRMSTCLSGGRQVRQLCFCQNTHTKKIFNTFLGLLIWSLILWLPADETSFEAGVKVQIHSQDEPSFIDQFGFGVAPGFQTFVSCQEQRVQIHTVDDASVTQPRKVLVIK